VLFPISYGITWYYLSIASLLTILGIKMQKGKITTVKLPPQDYKQIEELVREGKYLNKSDFLRKAVKKLLESESEVMS